MGYRQSQSCRRHIQLYGLAIDVSLLLFRFFTNCTEGLTDHGTDMAKEMNFQYLVECIVFEWLQCHKLLRYVGPKWTLNFFSKQIYHLLRQKKSWSPDRVTHT